MISRTLHSFIQPSARRKLMEFENKTYPLLKENSIKDDFLEKFSFDYDFNLNSEFYQQNFNIERIENHLLKLLKQRNDNLKGVRIR